MALSIKEQIIQAIETRIRGIVAGQKPTPTSTYIYANTVTYVDRQFINITPDQIVSAQKPWVIINNEGEKFDPLPSKRFDNKILINIVGFIDATKDSPDLDSLMNSLQRDILVAMISDVVLGGLATYLYPTEIVTVPEMFYPHGGFVIFLEVNYSFAGLNL